MNLFENASSQDLERVPFVILDGRPDRDTVISDEDICDLKIALSKGIGPEGLKF